MTTHDTDNEAGSTRVRPDAIDPTEPLAADAGHECHGKLAALLGRHPRWALVGVAVAVVVAYVLVLLLVLPPRLRDRQVLSDANAPAWAADDQLTESAFASNDAYKIVDRKVVGVTDNGHNAKVATVEFTFENESFRVVVTATLDYSLVGRKWVSHEADVTSVRATPIAAPDADDVVAAIDRVLAKAPSSGGLTLEQIYSGGEFEVTGSELADDATSATVTIAAEHAVGLYEYDGTITATFAFRAGGESLDAGTWELESAEATDASYEHGRVSLVGKWEGKLSASTTSAVLLNTGRCTAAESRPLTLDVKSFDPESGKMVCGVSFVSHDHDALAADAAGSDGDAEVSLDDEVILLDPKTLTGTWSPASSDRSKGAYSLEFLNEGGVWEVRVTSGVAGSDGFLAWGYTTFRDTYVLGRKG